MKEIVRLKASGSPEARALLRQLRDEPPESVRKSILALSALAPVPSTHVPTPRVRPSAVKPLLVGGTAILVLGGLAAFLGRGIDSPPPAVVPTIPAVATVPNLAISPEGTVATASSSAVTGSVEWADLPLAPRVKPSATIAVRAPKGSTEAKADGLGAELALIEQGRTALGAGRAEECLRLVHEYQRTFPNGELTREAAVLHVRAELARGNRSEAERIARSYLSKDPSSPYADRIRALIGVTTTP